MTDPLKSWPWLAKATIGVLAGFIGGSFIAGGAWANNGAELRAHSEQLNALKVSVDKNLIEVKADVAKVEEVRAADHDILLEIKTHVALLVKERDANAAILAEMRSLRDSIERAARKPQ